MQFFSARWKKKEWLLLNFQNLEAFLVLAEEGSVTRAAERLHVSQQALSGLLSRLEKEVESPLFFRRGALELTYAGKCFQRSAMRILDIQRQTLAAIEDANENRRGELRIGVSHTRGQSILPVLLPEFSRLYPLAELTIYEGSTTVLEEDLDKGLIDVLIGFAPFMLESAEYTPLMSERMYLVAQKELLQKTFGAQTRKICQLYAQTRELSVFSGLSFVLLKKGDRIRTIVDREFLLQGMTPKIKLETQNVQTAFCLAAEGMGLTVCPELYLSSPYTVSGAVDSPVRQKVEILPFSTKDTADTIAIGYNRERYLSKMARDFIALSLRLYGVNPQN